MIATIKKDAWLLLDGMTALLKESEGTYYCSSYFVFCFVLFDGNTIIVTLYSRKNGLCAHTINRLT